MKKTKTVSAILEEILSEPVVKKPNALDVIRENFELIERAKANGHSYQRIANGLQATGIKITPASLQGYLSTCRREISPAAKQVRKAVIAPAAVAPVSPAVQAVKESKPAIQKTAVEIGKTDIDDFDL